MSLTLMRCSIVLLLLASMPSPAAADVINVPADFPTIQAALDIAIEGDEIVVSPGTYNEALVLPGFVVTLRSSDGPEMTVIDATTAPDGPNGKSVIAIAQSVFSQSAYRIEGFTITGGTGYTVSAIPGEKFTIGGGIYISESGLLETGVVITDCIVEDNQASSGGGIYVYMTSVALEDSIIRNNTAIERGPFGFFDGEGGGVYADTSSFLTVDGCTFENNHAPYGAGGAYYGSGQTTHISNSVFESNSCNSSGGAIFFSFSTLVVNKSEFRNNSTSGTEPAESYGGGAIGNNSPEFTINQVSQCLFSGNQTNGFNARGGAILNHEETDFLVDGCVFTENSSVYAGGALGLISGELILNCTFANNNAVFGQAIFVDELLNAFGTFVANSVLWGNGVGAPIFAASNSVQVAYSIIEGGWNSFGTENLDADPMFVDAMNRNFSLMAGSPANDSGDLFVYYDILPGVETDIAGNPRLNDDPSVPATGVSLLGQSIDRGAYEFQPASASACVADLNGDGVLDFFDVSIFLTAFGAGCP